MLVGCWCIIDHSAVGDVSLVWYGVAGYGVLGGIIGYGVSVVAMVQLMVLVAVQ